MKTYIRHFVSQHVGKATATVQLDDTMAGHVRIDSRSLPDRDIVFSFEVSRVRRALPDRLAWDESLARIAIHQLHKLLASKGERAFEDFPIELALGTTCWVGDLAETAYGGATHGFGPAAGPP